MIVLCTHLILLSIVESSLSYSPSLNNSQCSLCESLSDIGVFSAVKDDVLCALHLHERQGLAGCSQPCIQPNRSEQIHSAGSPLGEQSSRRRFRPELPPPTNVDVLFVMPFFLVIICLFCAVGFYNICRDELVDELHASGIDVIRTEDGGIKTMPREYEY